MHAWYSVKMAEVMRQPMYIMTYTGSHLESCPLSVYARENGAEVMVTHVTNEREHGTSWDDIEYLGEVVGHAGLHNDGAESWKEKKKTPTTRRPRV